MEDKIEFEESYSNIGNLEYVIPLKDGLRHGESRHYYWSGVLSNIKNYFKGESHGVMQEFHCNKFRYRISTYKHRQSTGVEIVFKYTRQDMFGGKNKKFYS